jgi:hypothetical protein
MTVTPTQNPAKGSTKSRHPSTDEADYRELLDTLRGFAAEMQSLSQVAASQYEPVVDAIIQTRSRDVNHIEHTLDHLLDFCHSPGPLALFKRLCRYYWDFDPTATARQIYAYREMWDSDDSAETANEPGHNEGGPQ